MSRKPLALAAALVAVALQAPSAHAAPALAGTFDVTGNPGEITAGPDGNVWFTLSSTSDNKQFGKIAPDGTVTEYASPGNVELKGITAGPDGNLWATAINFVVKIPPGDPTSAQKFNDTTIGGPSDITTGPDSNLWTASGNQVIMVPPANPGAGDVAHGSILAGNDPQGIAVGSDGNLWIVDNTNDDNSAIVRFNTSGNVVGTPTKPGGALNQGRIAAGPAGQMLFTQSITSPQRVGRIDFSGNIQFTNMPNGLGDPIGVVFGNDGAYWIANFGASKIRRLTPAGDLTEPITLPAGARFLAKGANDTLWASLEQANKIARITGVSAPLVPPAGPPSPPPPAPIALPSFVGGHVFQVSKGTVTIPVACRAATTCVGTMTLRTAKAVATKKKRVLKLGSSKYSIAPGKTKRVKVKLSKAALRLLRKKPTLQAVATLSASGKTASRKVTIKAAKRKK
jgi:streptogramin lyase